MYKRIKLGKITISIGTFKKILKKTDVFITRNIFKTGIRNWDSGDSYNFSIVIGTFRIILSIDKEQCNCSG